MDKFYGRAIKIITGRSASLKIITKSQKGEEK
jgi:hypothetical protein